MSSSTHATRQVALIGAGPMAVEYAKVLTELGAAPVVIGRGEGSAAQFTKETGIAAVAGGVDAWLQTHADAVPSLAVVACGEKWIGAAARALIDAGVARLLVEKPGGFDAADIVATGKAAGARGAEVFVGYNRRFYASVAAAREIIDADGGVTSFTFEFTERSHIIAGLVKEEGVKEEWFLSNSTHVIDLAFHLGGAPREWHSLSTGGLPWHPIASVFSGAGRSESGALFAYHANWQAPGGWGLEICTPRRRLVFRPIETLQVQEVGGPLAPIEIENDLDLRFKPGLYRQVQAFLDPGSAAGLPTIAEQLTMLPVYLRMRGDKPTG